MNLPKNISICEVGPRDGLQNEKTLLSLQDKAALINDAIDAGFKVIEIGSFVSPKAIPALANTEDVFKLIKKEKDVELRVLVTNLRGVQRAIDAGVQKVKLTVSVSESHNLKNFGKKTMESMDGFAPCYQLATENGLSVSGAISTAFGCPFEGKISVAAVVEVADRFTALGIKELSLSDTTGMANPRQVYEMANYFSNKYPQIKWNLHFHNTRGMGMANVLAGIEAGITHFDASFAGLGGCPFAPGATGNISTEDLVHMLHEMDIETGINLDKSIFLARKVESLIGHKSTGYILKAGKSSDLYQGEI